MTTTNVIILGWAVIVASTVLLGREHLILHRDSTRERRRSARFPMFAVRDQLVALIASGKMTEDNPAWASAYRTVNSLLSLDERMNVMSVVADRLRFERWVKVDPQTQAFAIECEKVPEFADAIGDMNHAAWHMVGQQTSWVERAAIRVLGWVLAVPRSDVASAG